MKFAILFLAVFFSSVFAFAGMSCLSADRQARILISRNLLGPTLTVESSEIRFYYRVGYNRDIAKLELVHERGGARVFDPTSDGLRALLSAPTSGDLTAWGFEMKFGSPTAQGIPAHAEVLDPRGKSFAFDLTCIGSEDF